MKLLFKSFIVGLGITILGSIIIAVTIAVISFLEKSGGANFVLGFFFIVAVIIFGTIYYYQEKGDHKC